MTDIIEVPRELLYRISNVYAAGLTMDEEVAELRALLAQPASVTDAVRKDAERYRWLRQASHFDTPQHQVFCKAYGPALDEEIDAAMAAQPEQKP